MTLGMCLSRTSTTTKFLFSILLIITQKIDAAGTRPVSVGGDHSVTGGILQALGGPQSKLTGGEPACILHFDAHTDCFSNMKHFLGANKSAAHWALYLVQQGNVDAHHSVQIGI
tara:strand:- start:18192 stop:18533 length:342 start_codon:yes stop_codon:yes gene_type:complete